MEANKTPVVTKHATKRKGVYDIHHNGEKIGIAYKCLQGFKYAPNGKEHLPSGCHAWQPTLVKLLASFK